MSLSCWALGLLMFASMVDPALAFRSAIVKVSHRGQRTSFLAPPSAVVLEKQRQKPEPASTTSTTSLSMFMGSDGGLFGVGTPEVVTVLLVGYFVLGPSDLYKLVKEIGKFIQNIRTLGNDLTTTFESNMESQLQLQEIRKAQAELNNAFSFRRTINTNPNDDTAFATDVNTPRPGVTGVEEPVGPTAPPAAETVATTAVAATPTEDGTAPKKKIRRRVKKAPPPPAENPAELEMPASATASTPQTPAEAAATASQSAKPAADPFVQEYTPEEIAQIEADFDKYTLPDPSSNNNFDTQQQQSRFQQQLSGNWNSEILKKEDELSPLAKVMDMIALLEEEKIAGNLRLEEEFRKRAENEEAIYRKQRELLEEAAAEIQSSAFTPDDSSSSKKKETAAAGSATPSDTTAKATKG